MNEAAVVFVMLVSSIANNTVEVIIEDENGRRLQACENVLMEIRSPHGVGQLEWDNTSESYKTDKLPPIKENDQYYVQATCKNKYYESGWMIAGGERSPLKVKLYSTDMGQVPRTIYRQNTNLLSSSAGNCYCLPQPIICCDPCSPCCYPSYATASPVIYNSPAAVTSIWP